MEFEKVIVHVLDCEHNTCVISDSCLTDMAMETSKLLETKSEKIFTSTAKKSGTFRDNIHISQWITAYKDNSSSFEELSEKLANFIFEKKMQYGLYQASDLVVAIIKKAGRRYLMLMENTYMDGMTHHVRQEDGEIINEIIPYHTLISANMVKNDRAVLIELSDYELHCVENQIVIEGDKVNFYADVILQSDTIPSYKESVKNIAKITESISDKYHLDRVEVVPKMKTILMDNVEHHTPIQVEEMGDLIFASDPLARDDFKQEVRDKGVPKEIQVEYVTQSKAEKVHKIKTDKGIEVIIPIDFMDSKEFVEFQNQEDGTISIQLKNITHITSK